jgi:hypothetical protein
MTPDIVNPVVAFFNGATWSIVGRGGARWSGLNSLQPIPAVDCPIIDTTPILADQALSKLVRKTINPNRVELGELLDGAKTLGAIIFIPSLAEEFQSV